MIRRSQYRAWKYETRHPFAFQPRLELLEDRLPPGDSLGLFLGALTGVNLLWPDTPQRTEPFARTPERINTPADLQIQQRAGEIALVPFTVLAEKPVEPAVEVHATAHGDFGTRGAVPPSWDWSGETWDRFGWDGVFPSRERGKEIHPAARVVDLGNRSGGAPLAVIGLTRESASGFRGVVTQPFAGDLASPRVDQAPLEGMTLLPEVVAAMRAQAEPNVVPGHDHDREAGGGRYDGGALGKRGDTEGGGTIQHDSDAFVAILPPFDGYWDRWGVSHPSVHHTPWGGDWSLDYYAGSGTNVHFDVADWYYGGTAFAYVTRVSPACRSGVIADGGWAVTMDVYSSQYERLGWMVYAHLTGPFVSVGQYVFPGDNLGQLSRWRYSSCYQVTGEGGVHTHLEVYNYTHYACYSNWGSGAYLERWWAWLGGLGDHFAYSARADCGW